MTMDGKALNRGCVIDSSAAKVACDQLVKPPSPITDYLTGKFASDLSISLIPNPSFSGITAATLDSVGTRMPTCSRIF